MVGFFSSESWSSQSLPVLERTIPQCGRCGNLPTCKSPNMRPSGTQERKILVLTDAPSKSDDARGHRASDAHGDIIRRLFRAGAGFEMEGCTIYSALACRPPRDRVVDHMVEDCRPNVMNLIRKLEPTVIIPFGFHATKMLLGPEWGGDFGQLQRWVGFRIPSPRLNAWVCPTYDGTFVARQREEPAICKIVTSHVRRAVRLEGKPIRAWDATNLGNTVVTLQGAAHTAEVLENLSRDEGTLAFDYETTGIKPDRPEHFIHSISWCLNGELPVSGLVDETCHDALRAVLLNPRLRKVAHNAKFEERWSIAKLGIRVRGWHWDTMLAAHCLDNREGITGLKFQSYVRWGIGDYSSATKLYLEFSHEQDVCKSNRINRVTDSPVDQLLRYGGWGGTPS